VSCDKADDTITNYSNTSEKECKNQHIAEWGDVKSEPFSCLISKPFSQQDRLEYKRCTFSLTMCDHIFDVLLKSDYIRILDHNVEPLAQGRIYCKLHDSFEHSTHNCIMFHQIVQSAMSNGRLQFVETQTDSQSISIDFDCQKLLHRLPLADSYDDDKVHTEDNGIKLSSEEIIEEHVEDILEAGCSIEATPRISSTGGQQQNSKIDGRKTKQDKGRDKHKGKKTKVTFAELLEKYKKESEARSSYRPSIAKSSRSPPRRKSKDRDWQWEKFNAAASYPPFRPPMPMSWIPPYGNCYPYPSWDHRYDPRARYPSYYRSSNPNYAAPIRSKSEQQSRVKDRFNKKGIG
jgi:hypothetical protein